VPHESALENHLPALLMNALHGLGQEGVRYKTVQAGDLTIFYREGGLTSGPVILLLHGVPTVITANKRQ
jgi:hypothetical protein